MIEHMPGFWPRRWEAAWQDRVKPVFDAVPGAYVIAGGFLRSCLLGEMEKDVDLFFASKSELQRTRKWLEERTGTKGKGDDGDNEVPREKSKFSRAVFDFGGRTLDLIQTGEVQFAGDMMSAFDLTCCKAAFERSGRLVLADSFEEDCLAKRIRCDAALPPGASGGTIRRAARLVAAGWALSKGDAADMAERIAQAEWGKGG